MELSHGLHMARGIKQFTGFIRKKMGFSFLGETRNGEHWVIADVRIKNFDRDVGPVMDQRGEVLTELLFHITCSTGTSGATSRTHCESR